MNDPVKVRDLVWEVGIVDCATPFPGMKYVACSTSLPGSWSMWIDGVKFSHAVFPSEAAAKAAAQADCAARILAALDLTGVEALQAEVERLRDAVRAEFDAAAIYENTPTDRGGKSGPKGRAYAKWLDARAELLAMIAHEASNGQ